MSLFWRKLLALVAVLGGVLLLSFELRQLAREGAEGYFWGFVAAGCIVLGLLELLAKPPDRKP